MKMKTKLDLVRVIRLMAFIQHEILIPLVAALNGERLSIDSFLVLDFLTSVASGKEITVTDIATKLNHPTAAITGLVDKLEQGLLLQSYSGSNMSKRLVQLTPKGREVVEQACVVLEPHLKKVHDEHGTKHEFAAIFALLTAKP